MTIGGRLGAAQRTQLDGGLLRKRKIGQDEIGKTGKRYHFRGESPVVTAVLQRGEHRLEVDVAIEKRIPETVQRSAAVVALPVLDVNGLDVFPAEQTKCVPGRLAGTRTICSKLPRTAGRRRLTCG